MPATIDISELRIGYVLGAPIYDDKNVKLLGQGVTIAEKFISQLRRRGIRSVQVTEDDLAKLRGWRLSVDNSNEDTKNGVAAVQPSVEPRIDHSRFCRYLAVISQVGRQTRTIDGPLKRIRQSTELAAAALHAEHYGFGLSFAETNGMTVFLGARSSQDHSEKLTRRRLDLNGKRSLWTASMTAETPLLVEDLAAFSQFDSEFLADRQIQAAAAVPLHRGTLRAGVMAVFYRQARLLDDHDLAFFETVANFVNVPAEIARAELNAESEDPGDWETNRRYDYHCWQAIAPLDGDELPARTEYEEVLCRDISMGGFSFYYPRRPKFHQLAVALGKPPQLKQMKAVVVSCCETEVEGQPCELVGCRFAGPLLAR